MLVSSAGGEEDELWAANVLLLFWMSVRKDSEKQDYVFL